jgi:hypothetical protein
LISRFRLTCAKRSCTTLSLQGSFHLQIVPSAPTTIFVSLTN